MSGPQSAELQSMSVSTTNRALTAGELDTLLIGLAGTADRLNKVAALLQQTFGTRWSNAAQSVRNDVIGLRSDLADYAAGDAIEGEALADTSRVYDRVAAEDTVWT